VAENAPEQTRDTPETAALLRRLATDAIVLLKNEQDVLPLSKSKSVSPHFLRAILLEALIDIRKVAVIGPNAKFAAYCGGGSSSLPPYYAVAPFAGINSKLQAETVAYALGSHAHKELPLLGSQLRTASGRTGVSFKAYKDPPSTSHREVADEIQLTNTNMLLSDYRCPGTSNDLWYADIEGYFTPDETAEYEFGLCVYGTAKLYVDGVMIVDNETVQKQGTAFYGCGTLEETASLNMQKGKSYQVKVEFASAPACKLGGRGIVRFGGGGVRIGGARKIDPSVEIARAVGIASAADQVVLCVGLNVG
jgi:beta-glucosidase